jgi:hypothetical protein
MHSYTKCGARLVFQYLATGMPAQQEGPGAVLVSAKDRLKCASSLCNSSADGPARSGRASTIPHRLKMVCSARTYSGEVRTVVVLRLGHAHCEHRGGFAFDGHVG